MLKPDPYQEVLITAAIQRLENKQNTCIVLPTGGGKTLIASEIAKRMGGNTISVCHSREIVSQLQERVGGWCTTPIKLRNELRECNLMKSSIAFYLRDEAHRIMAGADMEIVQAMHACEVPILGLTATPQRLDGQSLENVFGQDGFIFGPSFRDLVDLGRLAMPTVYAPVVLDMTKAKVRAGDFALESMRDAVMRQDHISAVARKWQELAGGMRTIAFAADIGHARLLKKQLDPLAKVEILCSDDEVSADRNGALARLASGEVEILLNVGMLIEGIDVPSLECVLMDRPTMSVTVYLQQIGRVTRASPLKRACLILDCASNIERHGPPWAERVWSLSHKQVSDFRVCPECGSQNKKSAKVCEVCNCDMTIVTDFGSSHKSERGQSENSTALVESPEKPRFQCVHCKKSNFVKFKDGARPDVQKCWSCEGNNRLPPVEITDSLMLQEWNRLHNMSKSRGYGSTWARRAWCQSFGMRAFAGMQERGLI